jgi:segregation and condensation protein A
MSDRAMTSCSDAPCAATTSAGTPAPVAPAPQPPDIGPPTDSPPTDSPPTDSLATDSLPTDSLSLRLEGFEGPLDLLLDLARTQKVDLAKISILALVEQYLAVIEGARRIRLELAADWLVMAAWLAWLKSKLLLPAGTEDAEEAETAADVLASRLRDLQAMRAAALWLGARPRLGVDTFARGAPEDHTAIDRSRLLLDLTSLVRAYVQIARRLAGTHRTYRPRPVSLWSVQDALTRLGRLLRSVPDWTSLDQFLPDELGTPIQRRAALASTLMAGLEMARGGTLRLRQEAPFGPILLRRAGADTDGPATPDITPAQETPGMEDGA